MTKIFVTGVTGYIGGDALYEIAQAHPDYEITALVRNSDKGAKVAKVYPRIRLVYGDLDSADLIATEAQKADIVLREYLVETIN
jgi:N-acetyl-gamma-glutamylphosphate reductase